MPENASTDPRAAQPGQEVLCRCSQGHLALGRPGEACPRVIKHFSSGTRQRCQRPQEAARAEARVAYLLGGMDAAKAVLSSLGEHGW